jgi:uncharacterized protein (DUF2267 family)
MLGAAPARYMLHRRVEALMPAHAALFQTTVARSLEWIDEVNADLGLGDEHQALRALRAGLHAIRDRLPLAEVADLGAQLPALIRGLYYEGWRPTGKPERIRHPAQMLAAVRTELGQDPRLRPDAVVRATIRVLGKHVSAGETSDIERVLPRRLADIWRDFIGG